jgi:hypothetical protein
LWQDTNLSEDLASFIFRVTSLVLGLHICPFFPRTSNFTLKMKAANPSETLVSYHNTKITM